MKALIIFIGIFLKSGFTVNENIFEKSKIEEFVLSRCENATEEEAIKDIKNLRQIRKIYNFDELRDERKRDVFCSDTAYKQIDLIKEISSISKPCFSDSREKYFPNFLYNSFTRTMEFFCKNRTLETGQDCKKAIETEQTEKLRNCTSLIFDQFSGDILTKETLCSNLKYGSICLDEAINDGCPYYVAYRRLNKEFFLAVSVAGEICSSASKLIQKYLFFVTFLLILFCQN